MVAFWERFSDCVWLTRRRRAFWGMRRKRGRARLRRKGWKKRRTPRGKKCPCEWSSEKMTKENKDGGGLSKCEEWEREIRHRAITYLITQTRSGLKAGKGNAQSTSQSRTTAIVPIASHHVPPWSPVYFITYILWDRHANKGRQYRPLKKLPKKSPKEVISQLESLSYLRTDLKVILTFCRESLDVFLLYWIVVVVIVLVGLWY
jgi:hypothetical protein